MNIFSAFFIYFPLLDCLFLFWSFSDSYLHWTILGWPYLMGITPWLGHDCGWGCITYKPTILEIFTNIAAQIFFQVIKRITNGGADYSFECIGDTGTVTTALKSCCDVNSLSSLFHQRIKFLHSRISTLKLDAVWLPFYSYIGLGSGCYSWCTKDEARDNSSLWITS